MTRLKMAALLLALSASTASAQSPTLRSTILVTTDLVRIGDLVENVAPAKAQVAIFRSPDLGETGSVETARVIDALRAHSLLGIDTKGVTEISVTRASRMVGSNEIKNKIAEIASERLRIADTANIAVTFDAAPKTLHLDPNMTAPLTPIRVNFDARSGRFDIAFKPEGAAALRVSGIAQEMHDAVVAMRAIGRGEILQDSDVTVEKRPKRDIQGEALIDAAAAVGMAAQQPLRAGQPLRSADVAKPQLAKRGEPIVLIYEVPGIVLTARGKAEESGAQGETINVLNIQSKRVVQGIVTGPGQVTVTSLTPRITTAAANLASMQSASAAGVSRSAE